MSDKITLYIDPNKDYEKLLQEYYCNSKGYDISWLKGYVACLYASMIIDDMKLYELNDLINKLSKEGKVNVR